MNKYQNTQYDHSEDEVSKRFWEQGLSSHYEDDYDDITWYENGHSKDVEGKIDLTISLINIADDNYQIKTKKSKKMKHNFFFNIKQLDNYSKNDYNIDKIAFGLIPEKYIVICDYEDFISFWLENSTYLKSELKERGHGDAAYITFPLQLLREYNIPFDFVWVK